MRSTKLVKQDITKLKKVDDIPDWILEALKSLKPPEKLTVSQWADKYRILDSQTSAQPGKWNTAVTEYLRGIMDAFTDPEVEEFVFCKPTQVGGSECLNNMIGYVVSQDPSPTMVVYPTDTLAEFTSDKRLQPMFTLCPTTKKKFKKNESKLLELTFDGMYIALSGANSPSSLASRPVRFLFMDEIDKYPSNAGKEADPMSLAAERTKTFSNNKKIFKTSTPTLKNGPVWREWETADTQYKFFVPCPHCGALQVLSFKQIKWDDGSTKENARSTAYYECEHCNERIYDNHKQQMIRNGIWKPVKEGSKRKIGFHINAIYSPWVRFGDVAYQFLDSKDYPEKLMNFINSWLAEPWEETRAKMESEIVLERQSEYEEGIVPNEAILLTGGVDVQKDHFYFTIRAWGIHMTSWNVMHGRADSWDEVEMVMNQKYRSSDGRELMVMLTCVDSGNDTENVYEFCLQNQDWAVPIKGSSTEILAKYKESKIDKLDSKAYGMRLIIVDGGKYKDMIFSRLNRENGIGSWMVYKGCDKEYAKQITSEHKVVERKGGREVEVWKPKTSHADNHYLDCEVYAALAADLLHVRYMQPEEHKAQQNESKHESNEDNWLHQKEGGWI